MIDKKVITFHEIDEVIGLAKESIEHLKQFKDDNDLAFIMILASPKHEHGEALIHGRGDILAKSLCKAFSTEERMTILKLANVYMYHGTD